MSEERALRVSRRETDQGAIIEAVGAVDLATISLLREAVTATMTENKSAPVIVDLRQVHYLDSGGMGLLLGAAQTLTSQARPLHLIVAPLSQADRVLKLANFDELLSISHTLEEVGPKKPRQRF